MIPLPRLVLRQEPSASPQGQKPPLLDRSNPPVGTPEVQEDGSPQGKGAAPQDPCMSMLPTLAIFGIAMYFLIIRPSQKQEKAKRELLGSLKVGDKVVTTGGIHGTVTGMTDATVTIRVDQKVKLTVDRANIARVDRDEAAQTNGKSD